MDLTLTCTSTSSLDAFFSKSFRDLAGRQGREGPPRGGRGTETSTMATKAARNQTTSVIDRFAEELKYLTTNDSERIELLTTVARENEKLASSIVAIIEKHISACRADCKLWGLYLLDSVTKSRK